jgi:hypothetical protein
VSAGQYSASYARAAAVLAQLPPDDPVAIEAARETVPALLNGGSPRAIAAVRALALEDRRQTWGEDISRAGDVIDAVLCIDGPDWPEAPILPGPAAPDPLPLEILPAVIRSHVASVAASTQTPAGLGVLLSLASVSAAIGGRVEVAVDARGWTEPANVYAVAILPPASRKSPVYSAMILPLVEWERDEQARVGPSYRRARDRVDVATAALAGAKTAVAKAKATTDEVEAARVALEEAEAAVPVLPRLLAADATPEALVRLMAEQGGRIALLAPEADPLGIADGRYSDGGARLDELLRAWSAEPIRVDRIGREPVHVERPALTLGLTMQPNVLEGLRNARAFRGRGLMGRILWCLPPHGLGTRQTGRDVPPLDRPAAERYARLLHALLESGESAGAQPYTLGLSADALDVLYAYEAEVERELADGGRLAAVRDWAGKVCGQSVRLAALVELAARAEDGQPLYSEPVGRRAMKAGVQLARALTTHALAVLADMGVDRRTDDLRYVLRRAGELPTGSTLRDLHRATSDRPGLNAMDDLSPVVEDLVERGCIRLVERIRKGPGRPPSPLVELHPNLSNRIPDGPRQYRQNDSSEVETVNIGGNVGVHMGSQAEVDLLPDEVFQGAEADR